MHVVPNCDTNNKHTLTYNVYTATQENAHDHKHTLVQILHKPNVYFVRINSISTYMVALPAVTAEVTLLNSASGS